MLIKLKVGRYKFPVEFEKTDSTFKFRFDYNENLKNEIKVMEGSRWDPDSKLWTAKNSQRNQFQLEYLLGNNPYEWYDKPLMPIITNRSVMSHQNNHISFGLTRRQCIIASEMGTGKTLSAIEIMELSEQENWFWVAPKSAMRAAELEFHKWNTRIYPTLFTYEKLQKCLQEWTQGVPPPKGLIVDESIRVKTPSAKRSQAVKYLADMMRIYWGKEAYIILMSGAPATKSPLDWWFQCEIACPGFLREGSIRAFQQRLAFMSIENYGMGAFPKLKGWRDNSDKCNICGQIKSEHTFEDHQWQPSVNEVAYLYERMKGLVQVTFKKDCVDLPEKRFERIVLKPKHSTLNAATLIAASAGTAIQALTLTRELSDGFQYQNVKEGTQTCEACGGDGCISASLDPENPNKISETHVQCSICGGKGTVDRYVRQSIEVPCPKEDRLKLDIDRHEEIGRLVIYAGFTGSIDRICRIVREMKWEYIKVDGRGWTSSITVSGNLAERERTYLRMFQQELDVFPRIAFVGHAGSAGEGLTLTASPTIVRYSNSFNANEYIQSNDRIHRIGMDINRGATILNYIHLPTDDLVLDNLEKKVELQSITMGDIANCLKDGERNAEGDFFGPGEQPWNPEFDDAADES